MNKIKDRSRRRAALTDRKSAASQARMKNIAHLAADERVPKKRRKANGGMLLPPQLRAEFHELLQMICSELTTLIGLSIARL